MGGTTPIASHIPQPRVPRGGETTPPKPPAKPRFTDPDAIAASKQAPAKSAADQAKGGIGALGAKLGLAVRAAGSDPYGDDPVNKRGSTTAPRPRPAAPTTVPAIVSPKPAPAPHPTDVNIRGGGHAWGDKLPEGTTKLTLDVHVDSASKDGLNFFALQVNFGNDTWAHGGVQQVYGKRLINWGGLPNKGGGTADYEKPTAAQQKEELTRIQNGAGANQLKPVEWKDDTDYVYTIERGDKVTLPAGEASVSNGGDKVDVGARDMYEWTFTVTPAGSSKPIFSGTMYNSSPTIQSTLFWSENNADSTEREMYARYSNLTAYTADGDREVMGTNHLDGGARPAPEPRFGPL